MNKSRSHALNIFYSLLIWPGRPRTGPDIEGGPFLEKLMYSE